MAKDGGAPLPRRVPGATESPQPPAGFEMPVLPPEVRERLLAVIAAAAEQAAAEEGVPGGTATNVRATRRTASTARQDPQARPVPLPRRNPPPASEATAPPKQP